MSNFRHSENRQYAMSYLCDLNAVYRYDDMYGSTVFYFPTLKKNTTIKNLHHVLYQILIKLDVVYLSEQILDGRNLSTTLNFFDIILISHVHIAKINSFKFIFHFSARPKSDWCTGCENLKGFICPVDKDL